MNKIQEQYLKKVSDILYPKNKITIKGLFCINHVCYFYVIINDKKQEYYILEDSDLIYLRVDYIDHNQIIYLTKNKYDLKNITFLQDANDKVYLKLNNSNLLIIESIDKYLNKMFLDIYNKYY